MTTTKAKAYAWTPLNNTGRVHVSARAGHTLSPIRNGFVLFGGMDGRRNDKGNPSPNNDVYILKIGRKDTFEWIMPEIDPSSALPPGRTLHTMVHINRDELLLFAGAHSTTPYQVLNDGWTLDTTCFEWKRIAFKTFSDQKNSMQRRRTGRIQDLLMAKAKEKVTLLEAERRSNAGNNFTAMAYAASSAWDLTKGVGVDDSAGAGFRSMMPSSPARVSTKPQPAAKKFASKVRGPGDPAVHKGLTMMMRGAHERNSLMKSEEEQFHDDLLSMVTSGGHAEQDPAKGGRQSNQPAPRANHSATLCDNTLVVFGGHGGHGFQRKAFNDVWTLNLDNSKWAEMHCHGNPPGPRSGHVAFQKDGCVYIFGGWNSETQFNDLFMLDVENKDWSDLDLGWGPSRWNMAVQLVEAIPSWRVFIFGGSADRLAEGRSMGCYDRRIGVLELGEELKWNSKVVEEIPGQKLPPGREHTAMCYEPEESKLTIFGGWANKWLDDCWQISVSSIVGPPYAVECVRPPLGPVTGNQLVRVHGIGFESTPGQVVVRFSALNGSKFVAETQGTVISDELIECLTPYATTSQVPRECEVRLSIGVKAMTTTFASYCYFLNTVAEKSLCFGPGLLEEQQAGLPTRFYIQARNHLGGNRKSGRDDWVITVQQRFSSTQAGDEGEVVSESTDKKVRNVVQELPYELFDYDNGQYEVQYTADVGQVLVHVKLKDETGSAKSVRGSPFKPTMVKLAKNRANEFTGPVLSQWVTTTLRQLEEFYRNTEVGRSTKIAENDVKALIKVMDHIKDMYDLENDLVRKQDEVFEVLTHFEAMGIPSEKNFKLLKRIGSNLEQLKHECIQTEKAIQPLQLMMGETYRKKIVGFEQDLRQYASGMRKEAYYFYHSGLELAAKRLEIVSNHIASKVAEFDDLHLIAKKFDYADELSNSSKVLQQMGDDVDIVRALWDHEVERIAMTERFLVTPWSKVNPTDMEEEVKACSKKLRECKADKKSDVFLGMQDVLRRWTVFCPLVAELMDPAMRPRHWAMLMELCNKRVEVGGHVLLRDMWNMELHKYPAEVEDIGEQARQEAKMEVNLTTLNRVWNRVEFEFHPHKGSDAVSLMSLAEENMEILEEYQVQVQNMFASRFLATFESEVIAWQKTLSQIAETSTLLGEVQRQWVFLENLFIHSDEVKKELPEESERFLDIDEAVKQLLASGQRLPIAKDFCAEPNTYEVLEKVQVQLSMCQKALHEFMDGKRRAFPRFYFISAADLLDVLSNGNDPAKVVPLFPKFFNHVERFELEYPQRPDGRPLAVGMHACTGKEYVVFPSSLLMVGKVENYLERCIETFREALQELVSRDLLAYESEGCASDGVRRGQWLLDTKAAQCGLLVQLMAWVQLVENAFKAIEEDNLDPVNRAWQQQSVLLLELIKLTLSDLDKSARQKLMCAITLDAHNRDIQEKLVKEKVWSGEHFQWQSMLKAYWAPDTREAEMRICDAQFRYAYEYLGNGPRLVVTPLTDRIYVTATQALHLCMGCAPAGPAGTGKTESVKDLANSLARACYVINASPDMDYLTMGSIFKGLAASGAWGCFDEFNRLIPEVLSVCTVQLKAVCDALRSATSRFILQGDEIHLDRNVGVFITMNPGYLGRSELPEGLKALFRPITVMVPDFMLIMENMFMSEGFLEARTLALKFGTLYALNKDLLSKSNKYDWGMRAIKSVLVVAGTFKRADLSLPEEAVLMRSLRDTNLAKIDGDDLKIFNGLLQDLFPGVSVPRARDLHFEKILAEVMEKDFGYTNDPGGYVLLKITQLVELLAIRHSVFLMGTPGSFKSTLWRVLRNAKNRVGEKTTVVDFSPKAISTNELYGCVNMTSRDWKDGILSKTMRDLGQVPDTLPKWILIDGDLDANWIESMNSVMDDSRLLTLPSNERIPLKQHMKMVFEIRDLNHATPATATRAGILCMSDANGVQWRSYVQSWIQTQKTVPNRPPAFVEALTKYFDKYCDPTLQWLAKHTKAWVPWPAITTVSALCSMLNGLMQSYIENLEHIFVLCTIFSFGSVLGEIDGVDHRKMFSNWWKQEMTTIKYPSKGSIFDYFIRDVRLEDWNTQVERVAYTSETPMGEVTVPTTETVSTNYFMKALIDVNHPVMLVGLAGCGKTQSCLGLFKRLSPSEFMFHNINMSYYTDSTLLQTMMESPLEKKAGRLYAPPSNLQLIYLVDDLNMPALDKYNTQSAIELMKQKQDYSHWYDRHKISIKDIGNTQYLCCMNPTAGSFNINPRLQRHFWTSNMQFPEQAALSTIYSTYTKGHFEFLPFKHQVQDQASGIIKAALSLHYLVVSNFRKTAKNMHYEFNIRHMSGVFAGLLQARPSEFNDVEKLVLLWIHESERIYGDRLASVADLKAFRTHLFELTRKMFPKFNFQKYFQEKNPEQLVFAPFAKGINEMSRENQCYDKIKDPERFHEILSEAMKEYDSMNAAMDLVLFEDAMKHVARICRIIASPSGHPLLVGVGGSGRQSLSRLSAFIMQSQTFTLVISSVYSMADLKRDLQWMFKRTGEKDEGLLFLLTDGQISDEKFLVLFNDLLASGEVTDLFAGDDKDAIRNAVRSACKAAGHVDTPENLWNFYISRVRKNLHMSLCFSPVGDFMWSRARKFPALVNCTVIDWFQPWPTSALYDVALKFMASVRQLGASDSPQRLAVVEFFPFSFDCVAGICSDFMLREKRFAYTTPKTFLELIKLSRRMLEKQIGSLESKKVRLELGLIKLHQTSDAVQILEEELKEKAIVVREKAEHADKFAQEVGKEKAKVNAEAEKASSEAARCSQIQQQVSEKKDDCTRDLELALPLVAQAEAALNVLDKKDFMELKAFSRPPPGVDVVCEAALHLQAGIDPVIEVDKRGKVKDRTWRGILKMMNDPTRFLQNLRAFKQEIDSIRVPAQNVEEARRLKDSLGDDFTQEIMSKKAQAAGGLCVWIVNIIAYYDIICQIEPKRRVLDEATEMLEQANARHKQVQAEVAALEARLASLIAAYDAAVGEKLSVMAEAQRCQLKLELAQRLVTALSANGVIWEQTVETTSSDLIHILGDTLVACSFASYVGVFSREYREVTRKHFVAFLTEKKVPLRPECDPLVVLSTSAEQAGWCAKGLPNDRVSLENGAIMMCSDRWTLMIDPQTQGISWVKNKEADNELQVVRLGQQKLVKTIEVAIELGQSVLIENILEAIDAVLLPVVARTIIRRGTGKKTMKLGDREIVYNNRFKLFMQTKMSNPHFPPELQAECTIINFTVTEQGLEEQLLFLVVRLERPDLARRKSDLVIQQNEFKVKLAELEAVLLDKLSSAEGDILDDVDLIYSLEEAKATSDEAKEKLAVAEATEMHINETSEHYRPTGNRGALLFFLMMDLCKMHTFYKYSLDSFVMVVSRGVNSVTLRKQKAHSSSTGKRQASHAGESSSKEVSEEKRGADDAEDDVAASQMLSTLPGGSVREFVDGEPSEMATTEYFDADEEHYKSEDDEEDIIDLSGKELGKRVSLLEEVITTFTFDYVRRGLLDTDKLTVASMLALRILVRSGKVLPYELNLLINAPPDPFATSMPDNARTWLSDSQWAQLKTLERIPVFKQSAGGLMQNIEQDSLGWKRWFSEDKAELADLPRSCRDLKPFHRLFLLRVLRPDRIGSALSQFVVENLGPSFIEQPPLELAQIYEESTSATPIFFVLFPGCDPTHMVESFARSLGCTEANSKFVNISMGQGQEQAALSALTRAVRDGGWVMLQNIHLMQGWMKTLERTLEALEETAEPGFRCVLASEPPSIHQGPLWPIVPEGLLLKCVKIADEAPTDLKSNLRRSYGKFSQEIIDACAKPKEFKATLLALCFFHALISGRIKFGAQGWSKKYPFSDGDLRICGQVLGNYLNNAERLGTEVPWPDLRYIFGEIMYGGHITDQWDRRVCRTYLEHLVVPDLLVNHTLVPGFKSPDASKMEYNQYIKYIDERFPLEQPLLFGLHANAEIGFLTTQGISIFKTIQSVSGGGVSGTAVGELTASTPIITKYLDEMPANVDVADVRSKLRDEDYTPYIIASLQESERMNTLLHVTRGSLQELELGIGGQLNVTEGMELLSDALQLNAVSPAWEEHAYPSLKSLAAWFADLKLRCEQLVRWTAARKLLRSIWISGLFNPMSFLTAVMQVTARDKGLPLDYMVNRTVVQNTTDLGDLLGYPSENVYIHGLFLEGASWEDGKGEEEGYISESKIKELHPEMNVVHVFSVHIREMSWQDMYHCPIFITSLRGGTFIVEVNLRMDPDDVASRWILAGAALLLTDD